MVIKYAIFEPCKGPVCTCNTARGLWKSSRSSSMKRVVRNAQKANCGRGVMTKTAISVLVILGEESDNAGPVTMRNLGERDVVRDSVANHCIQRGGPACYQGKAILSAKCSRQSDNSYSLPTPRLPRPLSISSRRMTSSLGLPGLAISAITLVPS